MGFVEKAQAEFSEGLLQAAKREQKEPAEEHPRPRFFKQRASKKALHRCLQLQDIGQVVASGNLEDSLLHSNRGVLYTAKKL